MMGIMIVVVRMINISDGDGGWDGDDGSCDSDDGSCGGDYDSCDGDDVSWGGGDEGSCDGDDRYTIAMV